jgi:hypothetical protein
MSLSWRVLIQVRAPSSAISMAAKTSTTAKTAPMLSEVPLGTCEPTQTARSGAPVQTLMNSRSYIFLGWELRSRP